MDQSQQPRPRSSIAAVLIAVGTMFVLVVLLFPVNHGYHDRSKLTTALSNGRHIHQAAYRMAQDGQDENPPYRAWPGDLMVDNYPITSPAIHTTGQFLELLVARGYMSRSSLAFLFTGPVTPVYQFPQPFEGRNSVFYIFKVTGDDEDTAIFLATKNFHFGAALDPTGPYGTEGCVIVYKGGHALSVTGDQAMRRNIGVMPGGTAESPGEQEGNIMKD